MCYVTSGGSANICLPGRHISDLINGSSAHIDGTEINLKEGGELHPPGQDTTGANRVRIVICVILWGSRALNQIMQHILHVITAGLNRRSPGCLWGI